MDKQSQIVFFNSQAQNPRYAPDPGRLACLARLCGIREGARVLDVACGAGQFTRALLDTPAAEVVGVDFAPGMIEAAKRALAGSAAVLRCRDVMELSGEEYDCAVVCNAFQFFENRGSLIRQLHHLVVVGGRMMICAPFGRRVLNSHYEGTEAELTLPLPAAQTLANTIGSYFDVDILVDSEELYAVSGIRRFG